MISYISLIGFLLSLVSLHTIRKDYQDVVLESISLVLMGLFLIILIYGGYNIDDSSDLLIPIIGLTSVLVAYILYRTFIFEPK